MRKGTPRHLRRLFDGGPYTRQLLALVDGLEGRQADAREWLAPINIAILDPHQQFHLAESFLVAGDLERGLELLERSNFGFHPYVYMAHHCRFLDPVRHTPRFQARARAGERANRGVQEGGGVGRILPAHQGGPYSV